ncbi:UNVERIFIED_CONTAM: hypothetical protein Sangu_0232000, partial [Sesamum angustifolium]
MDFTKTENGPPIKSWMEISFTYFSRSFNRLQGSPIIIKLASAMGIVIFALWGLGPLVQQVRNIFLKKGDSSWQRSGISCHKLLYSTVTAVDRSNLLLQ